jgi:ABC-type branched-subunit amino acid transport system substrate-binding protein
MNSRFVFYILFTTIFSLSLISCSSGVISRREERAASPRPEPPVRTNVPKAPPEKIFEAGKKLYENKEYNKSYDYFVVAGNSWTGKPRELEAKIWAARSLFRGGRFHEHIDYVTPLLAQKNLTDVIYSEAYSQRFQSYLSINDQISALKAASAAIQDPRLVKESEAYKIRGNDIIDSKLSPADLEKVSDDESFGSLRAGASFRLGEINLENRDRDNARKYFSRSISLSPQSEWSSRAQEMLEQLEAVRRVEPRTIGVVLPMTGKYAAISQKTLRGVQMGLGLYNNYPSSFKLAVIDSEGNPDNARRGVEKLVKEDNAISVIGSVLSKTAPAVAAKAQELGLPSIALSQKAGITEVGQGVFRNSLTSEMQVRYLVKIAMEEQGMKRFAILYPNDLYGVEYANIFWDEVLARGGSIVSAQSYSTKETDFRDPIQRLVGTYYLEARGDEYKMRLNEWTKAQTRKTSRTIPPDDLLPPVVDFDGVFIPDSAKAMGQISAMLSFNGVKSVKLLGTNLWNVPGIAKRAGHFSNQLLFVDSFVSTDPRFASSSFVRDYKTIFNEEPGIFEVQAYDSALLLRQLISQGNTSRESLTRALSQVKDFPGAVGPLSITTEREIMRPLVALSLDAQGNITSSVMNKAP